jgi:hypothetical protein
VVVALAAIAVSPATTATSDCFNLTNAQGLRSAPILDGLEITADQKKEVRSRLSLYGSLRGYPGLDGIGLTDEQVATIDERIRQQVASWKPVGWPCAPLKNRAKVIALVKKTLVYNGFRPAIRVWKVAPRQVQLMTVRDGWEYVAVVAKTGARRITIVLVAVRSGAPVAPGASFPTPFPA